MLDLDAQQKDVNLQFALALLQLCYINKGIIYTHVSIQTGDVATVLKNVIKTFYYEKLIDLRKNYVESISSYILLLELKHTSIINVQFM